MWYNGVVNATISMGKYVKLFYKIFIYNQAIPRIKYLTPKYIHTLDSE